MFGLFGGSRRNRRSNKRSNKRRNNTKKNKKGVIKNPIRVLAKKLSKTAKKSYSKIDKVGHSVKKNLKIPNLKLRGGKRKTLKGGCSCNNQNGGKRRSMRKL
jgi:hypothetical protein